MKRSNRLVLLIGIFLALVAFVLIIVLIGDNTPPPPGETPPPTTVSVVVASKDIDLGARIQGTDVSTKDMAIDVAPANAYKDTSFVIGQIARAPVTAGQLITTDTLGNGGGIQNIEVPAGYVGMSIQVDQVTGVGTVIKPGDFVDIVTGFTMDQLVVPDLDNTNANRDIYAYKSVEGGYAPTSVKALAQGVQVLGTLLPPPPQQNTEQAPASPGTEGETTTLNGQQEIVIVAVPTQVAELVKFAQIDGNISLVLRSTDDCVTKPEDGLTYCPAIATTGITLRRVVDDWGVLPPQIVQVVEPTPLPGTVPQRSPQP